MLSVADIAKKALDGVASKLSGVVLVGNYQVTNAAPTYDTVTGTVSDPSVGEFPCRIVDESGSGSVIKSVFPEYVVTGSEKVFFIEGLGEGVGYPVPARVNDVITVKNVDYQIKAVQNILGTGDAYRVIVL